MSTPRYRLRRATNRVGPINFLPSVTNAGGDNVPRPCPEETGQGSRVTEWNRNNPLHAIFFPNEERMEDGIK
ncbi:hypothetical protein TNIN_65311 [Trichonephila inaurata madagascariensis]|uniref:Uncharacterized protein n=1 Tax=Trichonephila inaurata madagascariensis TaxID=2747483 RepID=A0A8X6YI02_9ARAC|nr:hypothetical protein TNIN_65311 [Trichonephila inaurata madagascariensis]